MNVTASKVMLVVGLAAYTYFSWDHLTHEHRKPKPEQKGKELTAAMVNGGIALALKEDPFDSHPLDRSGVPGGAIAGSASGSGGGGANGSLPHEPDKKLGDLSLQGVFISVGRRVAVINGKTLHEGEIMEAAPGGPMIRARQIGMDYAVIEGGGGVQLLRLADANGLSNDSNDSAAAPRTGTGTGTRTGTRVAATPRNARPGTGTGTGGGIGGSPYPSQRGRRASGIASVNPEER